MLVMRTYLSCAQRSGIRWLQKNLLAIVLIFATPAAATAHSISGQPSLKAVFALVGHMHNIDPELLEAIAEVESGGDPQSVSPKGALGLMQLMPGTASDFSVLDPFNPVANIVGAADFLDYLRNLLANKLNLQGLPALLAAYNAGPGAVARYGGIPPYVQTHEYVRRVIERYTNSLSAQAAVAPVLILGPKPYIIQLGAGAHTMQPEPVLIAVDGAGPVLNQLAAMQHVRGHFVAAMGTGTEPWIRRIPVHNHTSLPRPEPGWIVIPPSK
jgi:hypothetical protein